MGIHKRGRQQPAFGVNFFDPRCLQLRLDRHDAIPFYSDINAGPAVRKISSPKNQVHRAVVSVSVSVSGDSSINLECTGGYRFYVLGEVNLTGEVQT